MIANKLEWCPRCEESHDNLNFKRLISPIFGNNYFAMCPVVDEPILIQVTGFGMTNDELIKHIEEITKPKI